MAFGTRVLKYLVLGPSRLVLFRIPGNGAYMLQLPEESGCQRLPKECGLHGEALAMLAAVCEHRVLLHESFVGL